MTASILTALAKNPPNAIIASNDSMALGAVEGIHESGLDNAGIKVIGFDALPESLQAIKSGRMAATMEQSPAKQIRIALHELVDNIRNHTPMKTVAITPILITADNLNQAERIKDVK